MRTREEIVEYLIGMNKLEHGSSVTDIKANQRLNVITEVLLDIRELLQTQSNKE